MSMTLQALFEAAYGVLDQPEITLARGSYGMESEKQFCTIGALRQAAFGVSYGDTLAEGHPNWEPYREAFHLLAQSLPEAGDYGGHIPSWNDEEERTKEDVLALFRSLAAKVAE